MSRPRTVELVEAVAECSACPSRFTGVNALALAAKHYDHTGHPIATTIAKRVHYGNAGDHRRALEAAGQGALELELGLDEELRLDLR